MKVRHYREVEPSNEAPGVALHTVIPAGEAPNFAMRVIEVAAGSSTPFHSHDWEHEVFVLSGKGRVRGPEGERDLTPDQAVFVPPGEEHCFMNAGDEVFRFVCCIPNPK